MRKFARLLLKKLKNEPVFLIAFIAIVAQAGQKALDTGHFTFQTWMIYVFQASMALITRQLVSPANKVQEAYMRGLAIPHATPVRGEEVE